MGNNEYVLHYLLTFQILMNVNSIRTASLVDLISINVSTQMAPTPVPVPKIMNSTNVLEKGQHVGESVSSPAGTDMLY